MNSLSLHPMLSEFMSLCLNVYAFLGLCSSLFTCSSKLTNLGISQTLLLTKRAFALSEHLVSMFLVLELSAGYTLSPPNISIFYTSFCLFMHGLSASYALSSNVFLPSCS